MAIQKHNDDYNVKHGGKWNLQHVRLFVEATWGREASAKLFDDIDRIIIHSLKAVQGSIINDRHCFECYGYDILIDARLRVRINRRFGTSRPNFEILSLGHIEVDSADFWTGRFLSSSSRSTAEELVSKHSNTH